MHPPHHIEPPPIRLAIDEVLLNVEYSTLSTIEPRHWQCILLNLILWVFFNQMILTIPKRMISTGPTQHSV